MTINVLLILRVVTSLVKATRSWQRNWTPSPRLCSASADALQDEMSSNSTWLIRMLAHITCRKFIFSCQVAHDEVKLSTLVHNCNMYLLLWQTIYVLYSVMSNHTARYQSNIYWSARTKTSTSQPGQCFSFPG